MSRNVVVDERESAHALGVELGRGGQGTVYEVEGGRLAVKVLHDASDLRREELRRQLTRVKVLPLEGLPIARPLAMLKPPRLGYVMELVQDMQPLANLMVPKGTQDVADWYRQGGGLRRRIRLMAHLGDVLGRLHGLALAYSDPSATNVLVSRDLEHTEVWLIDADNLRFESEPGSLDAYTPRYAAPELHRQQAGVSTLTDAHAFSVLAFQTLTLSHPLLGDWVNEGEPELEEQALRGDLPWIGHPEDERNRSSTGMGLDRALSKRLLELSHRAFGTGLLRPLERPGLTEWSDRLHAAADYMLECPACGQSFYASCQTCSFCGRSRPTFLRARVRLWQPGERPARMIQTVSGVALERDRTTPWTARLTRGRDGLPGRQVLLEIQWTRNILQVRATEAEPCYLADKDGRRVASLAGKWMTMQLGWQLHFGEDSGTPHRFVSFETVDGNR